MEYKGKFRIVQVHCPVCHIDTRASYRHSYKKKSVILMKAKIELNIAWINLNGINSSQKGRTFSNFLDEFGKSTYDGIMVQEPRYKLEKQEKQDFNWESLCKAKNMTAYFTANERGAGGVGVIWKNKSVDEKLSDLQITEPAPGEAILSCFVMAGEAFAVCNLYTSAANKENKRGDLFRTLQETLPEAVIIGGDFNLVLDTVQDLQRPATTKSEYQNGGWDELWP
jgi:exonuclease III